MKSKKKKTNKKASLCKTTTHLQTLQVFSLESLFNFTEFFYSSNDQGKILAIPLSSVTQLRFPSSTIHRKFRSKTLIPSPTLTQTISVGTNVQYQKKKYTWEIQNTVV